MVTIREYCKTVIPRGTTAIFMDPHEIANVLGLPGVRYMMDEGLSMPLRVFTQMPSCVPAAPGFENAGAKITAADIAEAMNWEGIYGLGEMMNFPGVIHANNEVHRALEATISADKTVTGHYSVPETGQGLNAYIASGVRCCHESVREEDALAKMRLGMYAQLREGSAWHDVKETVKSITERKIDTRFAILISDDTHPHTLLEKGHLDHVVRRAIEEGVDPITAVQMVTINVAQCFHCDNDFGSVAPGKVADILLLSDLSRVKVEKVFMAGMLAAEEGQMQLDIPQYTYPKEAIDTVKLAQPVNPQDFKVRTGEDVEQATVRVMQVIENKTSTKHLQLELPVVAGVIEANVSQDIAKVAVVERHHQTGNIAVGFVTGFQLERGAVAATVAHDSHNILIMGTNDDDMALAANELAKVGGGMVVVDNGEVLALLPLPIAGLMSPEPIEQVNERVKELSAAWVDLGCQLESPFMTMALLALPVLPELRITDKGLVDTVNFEFVELIDAQ